MRHFDVLRIRSARRRACDFDVLRVVGKALLPDPHQHRPSTDPAPIRTMPNNPTQYKERARAITGNPVDCQ